MKLICEHNGNNLSLFNIHRQNPNNIQSPYNISYLSESSFSKEKKMWQEQNWWQCYSKCTYMGHLCTDTIAISPGTLVIPAAQDFQSYHTQGLNPETFTMPFHSGK